MMLLVVLLPPLACHAKGGQTQGQTTAQNGELTLNLDFLKKLGIDVTGIQLISDKGEMGYDYIDLEAEQVLQLLPIPPETNVEELGGTVWISGVRPLPTGHTMIIFSEIAGEDAATEMMGIYDKQGRITDFMQLGDMNQVLLIEADEDYKQGRATMSFTTLTFSSPSEFTLDTTEKEGNWRNDDPESGIPRDLISHDWLRQTVKRYSIDDNGRLTLVQEKEVKREGTIDPDYEQSNAFLKLTTMPMSDITCIDRLNDHANALVDKLGREAYDDEMPYAVQAVLAQYFDCTPDAVLMWIYDHRNSDNLMVHHLQQIFVEGRRDTRTLRRAIAQLPGKQAQTYLSRLTASWRPAE